MEGNGGNVGLGKLGSCRRLRAASVAENDNAMKRTEIKQVKLAILDSSMDYIDRDEEGRSISLELMVGIVENTGD
uniref:Uncharacterized protein n=1 Tax=Salix viminalis TaxID=40686 RepID=A0A6N2LUM6_SALVM